MIGLQIYELVSEAVFLFPCQTHMCVMKGWMCATIQCHVEVLTQNLHLVGFDKHWMDLQIDHLKIIVRTACLWNRSATHCTKTDCQCLFWTISWSGPCILHATSIKNEFGTCVLQKSSSFWVISGTREHCFVSPLAVLSAAHIRSTGEKHSTHMHTHTHTHTYRHPRCPGPFPTGCWKLNCIVVYMSEAPVVML